MFGEIKKKKATKPIVVRSLYLKVVIIGYIN
jgi:hypothetical protein